jgi:hypothetical protein
VYRSAGARPNPSSAFTSLRLRRFDLHVPTSFPAYPAPSPLQDHASQPPAYAPAITLASQPFQLLSTRHFPRTAVRPRRCLATGGATQQLPVAAVTGPVLVVLAAEPSWLLSAQTASVRRSVQPGIQRSGVVAVVGNVRTPAMASVGPRPPCGVHHPVPSSGSGCPAVQRPAVWCPVRPVSSPADVRPSGVQPLVSTRPASSRLVSAPVRPDASVWSQLRRWRWDQAEAAGNRHHTNGSSPGGLPRRRAARRRPRRPGGGRRCRVRASVSGVGGGPGRVGCGRRRPRLTG